MRRKTALTIIFTLLFSLAFNVATAVTVKADITTEIPWWLFINAGEEEEDQRSYGEQLGDALGQLKGFVDFLNDKNNDWKKSIPSKEQIISDYRLDRENEAYRNVFLLEFQESFREGYEEAFRNQSFGTIIISHNDGFEHGKFFGDLLGQVHGRKDFYNGQINDWTRWLPSDKDIIKEYSLLNDDSAYLESFIYGFKSSYKLSYIDSFRTTNVEDNRIIKENGINHGKVIGELAGEIQGRLDYMAGKKNDWRSGLSTDKTLIGTYNLAREHIEYMEGFLAGYKDGFREGYVTSFQNENLQNATDNLLNTSYISMYGGEASSVDDIMTLNIDPGSFHTETAFTVSRLNVDNLPQDTQITPASSAYGVKVQNISASIELIRPLSLEFEYYGSKSAGIYELRDGKWFYLHSVVRDNTISTVIDTDKYKGGTYIVLIDKRYEDVDDIAGHWAQKPIGVFLKRNYIRGYSDKTFRPDRSITRAEFVKILDNVYDWDKYLPFIQLNNNFKDSPIFGVFADSISKAVALGYVQGYGDNTFRPHISITYREVEWLMQRVIGKADFTWDTVAQKMLREHYVRSKSYNSKQNNITRAEVVYLLYLLEEGLL